MLTEKSNAQGRKAGGPAKGGARPKPVAAGVGRGARSMAASKSAMDKRYGTKKK